MSLDLMDSIIFLIGDVIAYIGILVICIGVIITLFRLVHYFCFDFSEERARYLRHALMIYISLGLDFLIAKDVVLTLLIESGDFDALIQLAAVIGLRVALSFFVHLEEKTLHVGKVIGKNEGSKVKPKSRKVSRKSKA